MFVHSTPFIRQLHTDAWEAAQLHTEAVLEAFRNLDALLPSLHGDEWAESDRRHIALVSELATTTVRWETDLMQILSEIHIRHQDG